MFLPAVIAPKSWSCICSAWNIASSCSFQMVCLDFSCVQPTNWHEFCCNRLLYCLLTTVLFDYICCFKRLWKGCAQNLFGRSLGLSVVLFSFKKNCSIAQHYECMNKHVITSFARFSCDSFVAPIWGITFSSAFTTKFAAWHRPFAPVEY